MSFVINLIINGEGGVIFRLLILSEIREEQGMSMVKELNIYFSTAIRLKHIVVICHFYIHIEPCYLQK